MDRPQSHQHITNTCLDQRTSSDNSVKREPVRHFERSLLRVQVVRKHSSKLTPVENSRYISKRRETITLARRRSQSQKASNRNTHTQIKLSYSRKIVLTNTRMSKISLIVIHFLVRVINKYTKSNLKPY